MEMQARDTLAEQLAEWAHQIGILNSEVASANSSLENVHSVFPSTRAKLATKFLRHKKVL